MAGGGPGSIETSEQCCPSFGPGSHGLLVHHRLPPGCSQTVAIGSLDRRSRCLEMGMGRWCWKLIVAHPGLMVVDYRAAFQLLESFAYAPST